MMRLCARGRTVGGIVAACVLGLSTGKLSAFGQQPPQDSQSPAMGQTQDQQAGPTDMQEEEVAHPFLTHMGVPEGVGVLSLRLAALATRTDGHTEGDFAFHFETGLTEFIGLHVRNDRFLDNPLTEIMFQFAAVRSKNGMSGFSPIIEFEIPTGSGGGNRINTLVGLSSALANVSCSRPKLTA